MNDETTSWMDRMTGKCAWCKKHFPKRTEDWGYGYKGRECCSYKCQRALERADPNSFLSVKERMNAPVKKAPEPTNYVSKYDHPGHAPKREITREERAKIVSLFKAGKSVSRIALIVHRSTNTIGTILDQEGARKQPHNRRSRFDQATIDKVNIMHLNGMKNYEIAKELDMSATSVSRMINGVVR